MSLSLVFRSKCHRSTFCLYRIWQLTFIASYLGNLTFPKVQTILFLNTLSQTNNLLPFSRKSVLLYFFNPVQFEYLPLTFKATQLQKYVSHLENNYIFGILASSWLIWLIWKWHSSTLVVKDGLFRVKVKGQRSRVKGHGPLPVPFSCWPLPVSFSCWPLPDLF